MSMTNLSYANITAKIAASVPGAKFRDPLRCHLLVSLHCLLHTLPSLCNQFCYSHGPYSNAPVTSGSSFSSSPECVLCVQTGNQLWRKTALSTASLYPVSFPCICARAPKGAGRGRDRGRDSCYQSTWRISPVGWEPQVLKTTFPY